MSLHKITKGLDLPIEGAPIQVIRETRIPTRVAVMADDFPGLRPGMFVEEGETVKRGQPLFEDRTRKGVIHTAPGAGRIIGIYRGARRALQSVVIELDGDGPDAQVAFEGLKGKSGEGLEGDALRALLSETGLWTALRARFFVNVPATTETCTSIFVNAMDSHPLAPSLDVVLAGKEADLTAGLKALAKLTEGPVFLCKAAGSKITAAGVDRLRVEEFQGPHPAGLVGTHIHTLDPVNRERIVWHIGAQDVVALGRFLKTGKLDFERVVALAGPTVKQPRLLRTRQGAELAPLVDGQLKDVENRVVSGSVLGGRKAMGEAHGYLGRYHQQITCLREGRDRVFLGWLKPGGDKFSVVRAYLGALGGKKFDFTTDTEGSHRAMVPIGMFEKVMPLDIMPTFLLRSLIKDDLERAEALGCLELAEEDLALCSFVSPGKEDYAPHLRRNLDTIWKEG
ncbi:MAG: Na(+)-translocating NADH-quinone reductase subunit A [Myxococcales bacterium]|nr:Na(+)-translocating NADH-quinone reductase subunit A [Myxococcales bacterium]